MLSTSSHRLSSLCSNAVQNRRHHATILCKAHGASNPRTEQLRKLLKAPGILQGPCCHDGLSARLIERAGFQFAFMSGFCTAGARLGAPDTGLITYSEMVDTGRNIHEATRSMPIIGDGDTGYGNAMNVKRTVRGYAQAGFAGILIEDQVAPKSCGHVKGKRVTSREEAVSRIRAAVDAREEGADILILARTDARQAVSMEEALWRVQAFADAGADILFIDALESEEEMRRFCWAGGAAARVPKMANMLEGGKTPILSPQHLQDMGFKLVAYPLSMLGVSIRAMEVALQGLKAGQIPGPDMLGSFSEIQSAVGFPEYFEEESKYAISLPTSSPYTQQQQPAASSASQAAAPAASRSSTPASSATSTSSQGQASTASSSSTTNTTPRSTEPAASSSHKEQPAAPASTGNATAGTSGGVDPVVVEPATVVVDADAVVESPSGLVPVASSSKSSSNDSNTRDDSNRRARMLRIVVTEQATGMVKLETRIPAGFLSAVTAVVPAVAGINIESVIERALRERKSSDPDGAIVNTPVGNGDVLQVFLE